MPRFKLDENIPTAVSDLLLAAGHDILTAQAQGLAGFPDDELLRRVSGEGRVLLTLDKDFSDIRRHPPGATPGIVVLRPGVPSPTALVGMMQQLVPLLRSEDLQGCLWVVDHQRVRIWPSAEGEQS